jgi:hypothetical protein
MSNPNLKNFSPGGIVDRIDHRDYLYEEVAGGISQFDWNKGFDVEEELATRLNIPNFKLTVKDQGNSYSCGGMAWGYLAEVLEALSTGTYEPRSAKYMYSQTYVPGGGSRGRDNADIFVNQGVAREDVLTSYQNFSPPSEAFMERSQDITDLARTDAKLSKASAYAQVGTSIEAVAIAIQKNHGVVLGVEGQNNQTWQSEFPKPPKTVEWRHWVYACGAKMIDGKKHVKIINSWGLGVGVNGVQWLGEDYFKNNVFSGWTHVISPPPPTAFTHNFLTNLNFGDNNAEVQALQNALKIDGTFPQTVPPSGFYGQITAKAVLDFQFKYKIILSGLDSNYGKICGPKTRAKINSIFNSNN